MKRILVVFGTRPEALKFWPIIKLAKEEYTGKIELKTYVTNQSEEHFIQDISADFSAKNICGTRQASGFGKIYADLEWFLNNRNGWNAVMVQGDTFSTLAGAQAAYFRGIPLIHIEAGLRTFSRNPWPEEMIRRQVDLMSCWRFSPTVRAHEKLSLYMLHDHMVGNTIIDRILLEPESKEPEPDEGNRLTRSAFTSDPKTPYVLCSLHRRESWDKFGPMMEEMTRVIQKMSSTLFVFLSHPNGKLDPFFKFAPGNVQVLPHQEYRSLLRFMRGARAVITDSGGLIEEAAYFRKPCFILRDQTERMESVIAKLAKLLGRGKEISAIPPLMDNLEAWFNPDAPCPYGDGGASGRILDHLSTCSWSI